MTTRPGRGSAHATSPAPAASGGRVLLAWARDRAGLAVHAAGLAAGHVRARGPFTCLGCGEPLVARLGRIRARHFAHRPGASCPLTAPETALHLAAKERLLALCAAAFAGARTVAVLARCPACRRTLRVDLGARGDAAEREAAVGPLRADVLVRAGGAAALAFEVRVTHAVAPEKEAALAAAAVPFVEIDAREEWEREGGGGVEILCARSGGFPPCAACAALARADADRAAGGEAAEIAELESYRARGLFGALAPAGLWSDLPARFRCPECGSRALAIGHRLARHPCPRAGVRPVAWLDGGGAPVELSWWRRSP